MTTTLNELHRRINLQFKPVLEITDYENTVGGVEKNIKITFDKEFFYLNEDYISNFFKELKENFHIYHIDDRCFMFTEREQIKWEDPNEMLKQAQDEFSEKEIIICKTCELVINSKTNQLLQINIIN